MPLQFTPSMSVALMAETDAVANLFRHSLSLLRSPRVTATNSDAIFACLSSAAEKMVKLTLGLSESDEREQWPAKATMKSYGHGIDVLDATCRDIFRRRLPQANAQPFLRSLLDRADADDRLGPMLAALTHHARHGRFYYLDALAESPQPGSSPSQLWSDLEIAVLKATPGAMAQISDPEQGFESAMRQLNSDLASTVDAWWELYFRCWICGVIGGTARQWSGNLRPWSPSSQA